MKIKNIEVKNFKAVSEQSISFNGCSAIVTGGNNKGKSTILKGLIDRLRGEKPNIIVKEGESKGFCNMELTDGAKIKWNFTEKSESFSYTTSDGIVMKSGVLSAIGAKYFGIKFDIDKFLNSTPTAQTKTLANLVGLDFEAIDKRYKLAYEERTDANKELKRIGAMKLDKPIEIVKPNIEAFKTEKAEIVLNNESLLSDYKVKNETHLKELDKFNDIQRCLKEDLNREKSILDIIIEKAKDTQFEQFIDTEQCYKLIKEMPQEKALKELVSLPEPKLTDFSELDTKIDAANIQLREFDNYERDLNSYNEWIKQGQEARKVQQDKDKIVKDIQSEKLKMISEAKIPTDFKFEDDGIKYKGFPLSDTQLSSSAKYIAALKLGFMASGDVKTMHFDASNLDNPNLKEIQEWANENDLQLLIERPDLDGGEIQYNIIS